MRLDPGQIEVVDDAIVDVLCAKTSAERLAIASAMYASARRMIAAMRRAEHPDWDEERISQECARRLPHGAVGAGESQ